jgi:protein-L-isoaspartate(D-aspartate) O-methyltransferase
MRVTFGPSKADQVVYIDARFLEAFSVEGVPRSRRFPADPTAQAKIVFGLQTQRPGLRSYLARIGDDVAEHSTFIFP